MDYFNCLPKELILIIINNLKISKKDLYSLMLTSKIFDNYCNMNQFWPINNSMTNDYKFNCRIITIFNNLDCLEYRYNWKAFLNKVPVTILYNKKITNNMKKNQNAILELHNYKKANFYAAYLPSLKIPNYFYNCEFIESLKLLHCSISTISPQIGNLYNLNELDLSNNAITHIPKEIINLKELKILKLYNNKILSIPDEIGQLSKLEFLGLQLNIIEKLPNTIGDLVNLKKLMLNKNMIKILPDSIVKLSKLEALELKSNCISSISKELAQLSNLKILDLEYNMIKTLPFELTSLRKLEYLNIISNAYNMDKEIELIFRSFVKNAIFGQPTYYY